MALFTGSGNLIFNGSHQKLLDCEIWIDNATGPVHLDNVQDMEIAGCVIAPTFGVGGIYIDGGSLIRIHHNQIAASISIDGTSDLLVANNHFSPADHAIVQVGSGSSDTITVTGNQTESALIEATVNTSVVIADNICRGGSGNPIIDLSVDGLCQVSIEGNTSWSGGFRVDCSSHPDEDVNVVISNNVFLEGGQPGIHVIHAVRGVIHGNTVWGLNGDDGITIEDCIGFLVEHNQVAVFGVSQLQNGITIDGGTDNIVVGNNLGASGDYSGSPIDDSGTGTSLEYPGDVTYGDNFVA